MERLRKSTFLLLQLPLAVRKLKISMGQGNLRVECSNVEITLSKVCLFLFIQQLMLSLQLLLSVIIPKPGRIQRGIR